MTTSEIPSVFHDHSVNNSWQCSKKTHKLCDLFDNGIMFFFADPDFKFDLPAQNFYKLIYTRFIIFQRYSEGKLGWYTSEET